MGKSESSDPLTLINKYGISPEIHQLWQRLIDRGYTIEIQPHNFTQFPFAWATLLAKFSVKKNCDDNQEVELEKVTYYSEKDISVELPFWIQFEDFLNSVDKSYHESVLPSVSGRTDGVPFDHPNQKPNGA